MSKYLLALDQGTTSSRALIIDHSGKVISVAQKEFTQFFPQPGWVEHDPNEIWRSQIGVAADAISRAYLSKRPSRSDVLSVFAGLRPLVKVGDAKSTAALSRDHTILISNSGLLTIAGGKWTTYRKMAQDAVEQAETMAGFDERPCKTEHLQIHGWTHQTIPEPTLRVYGADAPAIREIAAAESVLAEKIHPQLPYIGAEVVWAVREEMARTVEDVLARRTRALLLGARASIEAAPRVAELMARELGADEAWRKKTVEDYEKVAQGYVLQPDQ
jgi:glycerol-3-phosphate dehydrogenase